MEYRRLGRTGVRVSTPHDGDRRTLSPVPTRAVAADFNKTLNLLGLPALDATLLTHPGQILSVIGVPRSNAGSGWWVRAGHSGWLSVDNTGRMAFTPQRLAFDSSSASSAGTNTMIVAGRPVSATVAGGAGYHVVEG